MNEIDNFDQEQIGKLIKKLRIEKRLSQNKLGELVGVSGKAVYRWEKGKNLPDATILNKISDVLGITTTELLNGFVNEEFDKKEDSIQIEKTDEEDNATNKENERNITSLVLPSILILTLICLNLFFIVNIITNKKTDYIITSMDKDLYFKGTINSNDKRTIVYIGDFKLLKKDKNIENIKAIEVLLLQNDKIIYREGQIGDIPSDYENSFDFKTYLSTLKIYFRDDMISFNSRSIKNDRMSIQFNYIDQKDNYNSYVIRVKLTSDD